MTVSRARRQPRARMALAVSIIVAAAFWAGTYLTPWLLSQGNASGVLLHTAYGHVCHQLPERSVSLPWGQQAVCARCSGLYVGGVIGLILGAAWIVGRRQPSPRLFFVLLAPTAVDALLPWVGLPQLPGVPRLLLAVPAGAIAGVFLAIGIHDLWAAPRTRAAPASHSATA